jgi:hypothetical protein
VVYNLNHFLAKWIWGGKFSSIWSSILRSSCYFFSNIFCDFIICHGIFICHHLLRTTDDKIGIVASPLSTQYFGARSKTCYARKRDNKLEWSDMPQGLPYLLKTGWHDFLLLRVKNIVYSQISIPVQDIVYTHTSLPRSHQDITNYETCTHEKNWGWTRVLWKGRQFLLH